MMNKAIGDVINERKRQLNAEGYSTAADDGYVHGELAAAAAVYAMTAVVTLHDNDPTTYEAPDIWPWAEEAFKPKSQREDLVRAAALLIAEIERIDRKNNS